MIIGVTEFKALTWAFWVGLPEHLLICYFPSEGNNDPLAYHIHIMMYWVIWVEHLWSKMTPILAGCAHSSTLIRCTTMHSHFQSILCLFTPDFSHRTWSHILKSICSYRNRFNEFWLWSLVSQSLRLWLEQFALDCRSIFSSVISLLKATMIHWHTIYT